MLLTPCGSNSTLTKRTGGQSSIEDDQAKPAKACQGCRISKVRCVQPDIEQPCMRCKKQGRPCLAIEESNKKQKQYDDRSIDEIEARLAALTDLLQGQQGDASTLARDSEFHIEATISGIVDDETANMVFEHFKANMLSHFPFVAFSLEISADDIRTNAPTLFLAILDAAGDGFFTLKASRQLRRLLVQTYSTSLHETTACSISTLQASIISATWHRAFELEIAQPEEHMDVFQISNAAANMAMSMNLGDTLQRFSWSGVMPIRLSNACGPATDYQVASLEIRRVWLSCYYICSHTAMAQQTPNVMRWTRHMDECLEVLETSSAGFLSDKILCSHVRLHRILEEYQIQVSSSALSPTAAEVTYKAAKRQLADWTFSVSIWNDSLRLSHQFAILYMHEVPISSSSSSINQTQFSACLSATHALLDTFISLEMSVTRTLPTLYSVHLTHATIVLVKLHFAATRLQDLGDAVQKIQSIDADRHLAHLLQKFSGWGTLWPTQRLAEKLRTLREMIRQSSIADTEPDLAWLDVWTLKEKTLYEAPVAMEQRPQHIGKVRAHEVGERLMPTVSDGNDQSWHPTDADVFNTAHDTLPSASLDIAQLNDWFGTDLNTSTFDFDGNLQSMIQFYD